MRSEVSWAWCFWMFSRAMESSRKKRCTDTSPSSLARRVSPALVDSTPSATVPWAMKSTLTSREASPSTRSIWTKTALPAAWARLVSMPTVTISPKSRKITGTSLSSAADSPSSSFTEAMIGFFASSSSTVWRSTLSNLKNHLPICAGVL